MLNQLMARLSVAFMEVKEDEGQTMIEYALLAVFISIVAIVFLIAIGVDVTRIFTNVDTALGGANGAP